MNSSLAGRCFTLCALSAALFLAACGGDDDDTTAAAPVVVPPAVTQLTGAVVKGPVAGAQVCGYAVAGSARGAALGTCVTTDANGNYTLSLPVASGPLWLEASGGSYTDEATSAAATLPAGSVLASLATANGGNVTAMLTPLTTLALNAARAAVGSTGTLDAAAFQAAATALLATFDLPATLDLTSTLPAFGTAANDYGTALTIVSRMVAAGLTLADLLATANPADLQAAYQAAAAPTPPPATPLVISAATPAVWNGTLGQATAQFEHGSGSSTGDGPYDAAQPYCRLAVYGLLTSDGVAHFLQIPFRKDNKELGLVSFGLDASFATEAREQGPLPGLTIDTVNRRITFVNVVIGTGNAAKSLTLNGTLDYPTNVEPANRAACG
jgi:hypothetical protein